MTKNNEKNIIEVCNNATISVRELGKAIQKVKQVKKVKK